MRSNLAALVAAVALLACASNTQFVEIHKAPDAGTIHFGDGKVAAFALGVNEPTRRASEDAIARELTARGMQGVAGYTLLASTELDDREAAKAKLRQAGVEGVVALRLVDAEDQVVRKQWASQEYELLGPTWSSANRGYQQTSTTLSVETTVYSVAQDRLLWSGLSRTTDAPLAERFISEHAQAVSAELRREGLIR